MSIAIATVLIQCRSNSLYDFYYKKTNLRYLLFLLLTGIISFLSFGEIFIRNHKDTAVFFIHQILQDGLKCTVTSVINVTFEYGCHCLFWSYGMTTFHFYFELSKIQFTFRQWACFHEWNSSISLEKTCHVNVVYSHRHYGENNSQKDRQEIESCFLVFEQRVSWLLCKLFWMKSTVPHCS